MGGEAGSHCCELAVDLGQGYKKSAGQREHGHENCAEQHLKHNFRLLQTGGVTKTVSGEPVENPRHPVFHRRYWTHSWMGQEVGAEDVLCDIGAKNTDELWEEGREEPCDLVDCIPPELTVA